jgi:hypothetical protein
MIIKQFERVYEPPIPAIQSSQGFLRESNRGVSKNSIPGRDFRLNSDIRGISQKSFNTGILKEIANSEHLEKIRVPAFIFPAVI